MIASRSPYYVGDNNTTLVVEIYAWAIGTTQPGSPNYTIRKLSYDQSVAEYLTINASPFLVEKLSMAAPLPSQYPTPYGSFAIQNVKIVINDSIPIVIADPTNLVLTEEVLIPKDPTFLQEVAVQQTNATVRWTKSTTGPMVEYRIYFDGTLKQVMPGDVSQGTILNLTADTSYSNVTVRAWNGDNESTDSNPITIKTIPNTSSIQISTVNGGDNISGCSQSLAGLVYKTTSGEVPVVDTPAGSGTKCYRDANGTQTFDGQYRWWKYGNNYSVLMNNVGSVLAIYQCGT